MKNAFVIATAHQKGGTGKSTTAISLAIELAKVYDTVVVDLDKVQKSLTTCLLKRKRAGLEMPHIVDISTAEEVKELINTTPKVILIDVGGYDSPAGRMALLGADIILSPVSDSGIELDALVAWRGIIRNIRESRKDLRATMVFTRVHTFAGERSLGAARDWMLEQEEFDFCPVILRERKGAYREAYDNGKSVVEIGGPAADEMNELINYIKEKIDGTN